LPRCQTGEIANPVRKTGKVTGKPRITAYRFPETSPALGD
jgi:hypothetical protein